MRRALVGVQKGDGGALEEVLEEELLSSLVFSLAVELFSLTLLARIAWRDEIPDQGAQGARMTRETLASRIAREKMN